MSFCVELLFSKIIAQKDTENFDFYLYKMYPYNYYSNYNNVLSKMCHARVGKYQFNFT